MDIEAAEGGLGDRIMPPDVLHIYYIEGELPFWAETRLGASFLGNWEEEGSCFLFFDSPAEEEVKAVLEANPGIRLIDSYCFSYEEWQGGWLEPFHVGPLCICPAWLEEDGSCGHEGRVLLDPGVVFGSGLHPTTRGCLRAMAWVMEREAVRSVLDLGTGTGVLAIAAARLGAERVLAVDLNPLCVKTAERNVRLNRLAGMVEVVQGRAEDMISNPAELAVANLHLDVLYRLLQAPAFLRREWLVLSGLMRSGARDVKELLAAGGAEVVMEFDTEMTWFTLLIKGIS
ncbi:MAG: 50S ribosomal protein L11 methyltransferase [Desulfobacteraceae bacterium]